MLEIRMTKLLLVISEADLLKCLCLMPGILEQAVRRGKGAARAIKEQGRTGHGGTRYD